MLELSTDLAIRHEASRCPLLGPALANNKKPFQHCGTSGQIQGKSKGIGALRRICAEILPPETVRPVNDSHTAGLKGVVKHRLADTLKRQVYALWGLAKSRQAGHEVYSAESQVSHLATECKSFDTAAMGHSSVKNTTSRNTLMDNIVSLEQHTPLTLSRDRSWARLDSNSEPSRSGLDSVAQARDWCVRMLAPHVISKSVVSGDHTTERQFVLRHHEHFRSVVEVLNCQTARVEYRRIVQHGKRWCTSFHGVSATAQAPSCRLAYATLNHAKTDINPLSTTTLSLHVEHRDISKRHTIHSGTLFALPSVGAVPLRAEQVDTWRIPDAWQKNTLWEISSPQPDVFPLHCRDVRGALNTVPLTPMVRDRYQFCYRFCLSGIKMRWQACYKDRTAIELQCFVRSSVVALLLFAGHSNQPSDYQSSSRYASVVILPAAFTKLSGIDSGIVESFVLFTGIEVFQCFLYML
ncbi:hypothetical protein COEREDRAFT_88447 [Coemansia reversa NRRL 1564]|uniref:Uncharacterized protein n=1 Tax=Coemansia reversa (strain ATCC 12441 / NRRL 1564) TaxID=763665 RepID=A0A2G5B6Y1_COERN|nr:hypothetical protein COEREDRAFT_88447 [Coemansia reversa NRRL 1564]|eukprot:PIA14768.1 hypothetical protein COEREDRAFT_88447 [Coemansia reversa NRRL 1564]